MAYVITQYCCTALGHLPELDIVVEGDDIQAHPDDDVETAFTLDLLREYSQRPSARDRKRIVFRFNTTPVEILGDGVVTGVRVVHRNADGVAADEPDVIHTNFGAALDRLRPHSG